MKSFGLVNYIDAQGYVELPEVFMELCDIKAGESLEMYLEGENIILQHSVPVCTFCGSQGRLKEYMGRNVCSVCAEELRNYSL